MRLKNLSDSSGQLQHDDKVMADLLQEQFCSVFSNPNDPAKKYTNLDVTYDQPLESVNITIDDVDKALKKTKIQLLSRR